MFGRPLRNSACPFGGSCINPTCHYCHQVHQPHRFSSIRRIEPRSSDVPVTADGFFKIVIVLDESGSMQTIKNDMLKSINDLITEQKQVKGRPATFTLVKFSDTVSRVIKNKSLDQVNTLTTEDYMPSGSTALYDAIGDTINWFRNERDVLMVIVTDGQENASTKYNKYNVTEMIDSKKINNNWSYVYLSCDMNTFKQGNSIGLERSSAVSNVVVNQGHYGDFISQNLNVAVKNFRTNGQSVQSQLNK